MKLSLRALRRRFTSQIDNSSSTFENSNFLSKTRNPRNFIAKLKAKARIDCLDERQKDLSYKLSQPDVWNDSKLATDLSLELATIRGKLTEITDFELALSDVTEMYHMALEESNTGSSNREIVDECFSIINQMEIDIESRGIIDLMVGKYDEIGSCFLQINAGAGGTEACDWVGMIYRMYRNYCKLNELVLEVVDENVNDETANVGYRTITLRVKGKNAYFWMKSEAGVHRLVRISPFDVTKKRHTTFAQVLVYPELDESKESELRIEDIAKDIKLDTFRSSGAGGQSVQKTDSAVRITHIPTGLVVSCQNERSQHVNKATALSIMRSRLLQLGRERASDVKAKTTVGTGDNSWGNQIRSVVMQPYQLVKDHRTGWETGNVEAFMEGAVLQQSLISTLKHFADKEGKGD